VKEETEQLAEPSYPGKWPLNGGCLSADFHTVFIHCSI